MFVAHYPKATTHPESTRSLSQPTVNRSQSSTDKMCVIVQYLCPKCKKETGQRDYLCHTDGQRFAIPDPKSKSNPHLVVVLQSQTSSSKPMCNSFPAMMKPALTMLHTWQQMLSSGAAVPLHCSLLQLTFLGNSVANMGCCSGHHLLLS